MKPAADFEKFDFWKHGSDVIVQHVETGESGLSLVKEHERLAEVLVLYVNFGNGYERAQHWKFIVRKEAES